MQVTIKHVVVAVCLSLVCASARAADGTWTGGADGLWSEASNWQGGTVASGAGFTAYLDAQAGAVAVSNNTAALKLAGVRQYGGNYTLKGGAVTFEGDRAGTDYGILVNSGTLTFEAPIYVNRATQVVVEDGAVLTTAGVIDYLSAQWLVKKGGGEWVFSGHCAETNSATYLGITGGWLRLAPGAAFTLMGGTYDHVRIGYSNGGACGLEIGPGARFIVNSFCSGYDTGSPTAFLVDGGALSAATATEAQSARLGMTAPSELCLSNNATADFVSWLNVGLKARAEVRVTSGSTLTAAGLSLGYLQGTDTTMNGPALVRVDGGTVRVTSQFVWRAVGTSARTNEVTLGAGGLLALPATVRHSGNAGFARLKIDGGTLEFLGVGNATGGASLTNYLYGLDEFLIGRAGAAVMVSNLAATVTQTLAPVPGLRMDGGLTKLGTGTLTLAGGAAYAGPTVIAAGTLHLSGAYPTNTCIVAPGAALSLADGQMRAFAPKALTIGQGGASTVLLEANAGGACDSLALPAGANVGEVSFALSSWRPGDYTVATYAGNAPDIAGWTAAPPAGIAATFEMQGAEKRVIMHVTGAADAASAWLTPGAGDWADAANWSAAPAAGANILFGDAPGAVAQISIGAPVTAGTAIFDSPARYTLVGAAFAASAIDTLRGDHEILAPLSLPEDLPVGAAAGATLRLSGGSQGAGRVRFAGTGTGCLVISNNAAWTAPVSFESGQLYFAESGTLDFPLTVGANTSILGVGTDRAVTLAGAVDGPGPVTVYHAASLTLAGTVTVPGKVIVKSGTLATSELGIPGSWVIGAGRLHYIGTNAVLAKGLTLRTDSTSLGGTFASDSDVALTGNVVAESGVFIKAGGGTLTLAGGGTNTFNTGPGSSDNSHVMNFGAWGQSPTYGLHALNIVNGTLVLGAPGQVNAVAGTLIVGGETTTAAGAETAGHLVVTGGTFTASGTLTVGRGNGTETTAPGGLESSVTVNGGTVTLGNLSLGTKLNDMSTINARPLFTVNGGDVVTTTLYGGNTGGARPRFVVNGGRLAVTGTAADAFRLAYGAGVESTFTLNGGTAEVARTTLRLAENAATAKGTLTLNGGRLVTRGINRQGAGTGDVVFNGGVLAPNQNMTLANLSSMTVQAGGFAADVPAGVTLTVAQAMAFEAGGGIAKTGGGTLALAAAQTGVGTVTLAGGTLSLADGVCAPFAPTGLTVAGGAVIALEVTDGSACDSLALPAGFSGALTLRLVKTGAGGIFTRAGRYPVATFSGAAPDTSAWAVEGLAATFETQGTTVYAVVGANTSGDASEWMNADGGDWGIASNWNAAPANDTTANVLFGGAIAQPRTIHTGAGAVFGYMALDNANAYTFSGGPLTVGAGAGVAQGAHTIDADISVPDAALIGIAPGAALQMNGALAGAGSLTVAGGGTLALTNGPLASVPVTLDGVTFAPPVTAEFGNAFALGAGGAAAIPGAGATVTLTQPVTGAGAFAKAGSSILALAGGAGFTGALTIDGGTVEAAAEPAGPLVIGEGTFRYTGPDATFQRGYTLRTASNARAATFETDADLTFNGPVNAENGAFLKLGSGTLTYAYPGLNVLSAGDNSGSGSVAMNRNAMGDSPTTGYRSFNVFNGTVTLGAPGQTNILSSTIVVGGESTTAAGAETAGHMIMNGGTLLCGDFITVGRGNGSAVTAPDGLESTFTLNAGDIITDPGKGVWLGAMLGDMATLTARPRFTVNGGTLTVTRIYCGNAGGSARPVIDINGGTVTVNDDHIYLAYAAGCETVFNMNGGEVTLIGKSVCLANNYAHAKGTLNLNGGCLTAHMLYKDGTQSAGIVNFNGGTFAPTMNGSLSALTLNVLEGGAVFDVPAGVTHTVNAPLAPGDAPDGGLTKLGPGILELAATNTFTSAALVSNGVLRVAPAGRLAASSVTVAPGGTLSLQNAAGTTKTLNALAIEAGGELAVTADSWAEFATPQVVIAGDATLAPGVRLQLWSTGIPANGTYTILSCGGTLDCDPAALTLATGVFDQGYAFAVVGGELRLTVSGIPSSGGAAVWTHAGGGDWADPANWFAAPGAGAAGLPVGFSGAITAPAPVNIAGAVTAGALTFANANAYTLGGAGTLTLAATNGAPVPVSVRQGIHTVALPVSLPAEGVAVKAEPLQEVHLTGPVSGVGGITLTGGGRLRLAGANTYAGGTTVGTGSLDIQGASPLGTGPVTLNSGVGLASQDTPATVPNALAMTASPVYIGAYSPLTLSGPFTLAANGGSLCKVAADELTFAGSVKPAANVTYSKLEIREGSVRFAAGADARFKSAATAGGRNAVTFETANGVPPLRVMTVEAGAKVEAGCILAGSSGRTNRVNVTGGSLMLTGGGVDNDAILLGHLAGTVCGIAVTGGELRAADGTWAVLGVDSGPSDVSVGGGILSLAKVSLGVRDEATRNSGPAALPFAVAVSGGTFEARECWNWMADGNGARLNEVWLDGGRLRLPPTYATFRDRWNVSRLVFNGGVLETAGGGLTAEDPGDYLKGLKAAAVAAGGAKIDTCGRTVTLAQRLAGSGDVVKRGVGTLVLAKPPCLKGRVDVQSGTLRQMPEEGLPYPDDPVVRLTFDGADLRKDSSAYTNALGLVGSADDLTAVDGVRGNAARLAHLNALSVPYRDDARNADRWSVSVWVRQNARGSNNQRMTFFGTLNDYTKDAHDFLLRILGDGTFRWLGTGAGNVNYGVLYADVADAVPLGQWTMLTFVVDGLNGFSMYVNGERRAMRVTSNSGGAFTTTEVYGAGAPWLLLSATGGRTCTFGAVADTDTDCFEGDIDEATVYRRALCDEEIALLYQGRNPQPSRVRVAPGAVYDLAGAAQSIDEITGEGTVGNGTAVLTGTLNPGMEAETPAGAALTFGDGLTLGTNITYACDWTPEANDTVDVWGTLTVDGAGTIDLGLTTSGQMPGAPRVKRFPVMYYSDIVGAANFSRWQVRGIGRSATASVTAADGVVTVTLDVPSGMLVIMR
jgi:autotransporter-associated beta strand protein